MQKLSNMISMEQEPVDSEGGDMPKISRPLYPYGLSFCLENSELEKLDVDIEDWAVGDIFPLDIFAKLTSLSQNESTDGKRIRAEFQNCYWF